MMKRYTRIFAFATVLLLGACQTTIHKSSAIHTAAGQQKLPTILSLLVVDGKGYPNGRSDSQAPYVRTGVLAASKDPIYGYTAENPVHTGDVRQQGHKLFLNSLRGFNGEPVAYERKGACCRMKDAKSSTGFVMLDVYEMRIDGSDRPVLLYVDMYRPGEMLIPVGFTARKP